MRCFLCEENNIPEEKCNFSLDHFYYQSNECGLSNAIHAYMILGEDDDLNPDSEYRFCSITGTSEYRWETWNRYSGFSIIFLYQFRDADYQPEAPVSEYTLYHYTGTTKAPIPPSIELLSTINAEILYQQFEMRDEHANPDQIRARQKDKKRRERIESFGNEPAITFITKAEKEEENLQDITECSFERQMKKHMKNLKNAEDK